MEVAPLVRDFLGLQGSLSPDEAVLVSKLQRLHERYVAIIDDFSVQVNAKALRMTSVERVMAHQLRLNMLDDWRRQLMDYIVQGNHQGGVDDDALEHKSDCACNDCKLAQRLDKYRSAIQDFVKASGRINKGDDAGTEVAFKFPGFLDSFATDRKEQSMQIQSIEAEATLRDKHSQTGKNVGEVTVPDPESKSGPSSSPTVWVPDDIDYAEDKAMSGSATRKESILTSQAAPAAVSGGIDKNDDQKSETEMEQEVHQQAMEEQDTVSPDEHILSLSISDKFRLMESAACDRPHLCIYRSLVKRLIIMYGSTEDDRHIPKLILALVERLYDSMSATAFEFNGASMLLRGAVILCEVNEHHNDLSLHRAENDVPGEEWEVDWQQDCLDYVQVLKDHVTTTSTDSPPPPQTDVAHIMSKYVNVLPKTVRAILAEFITEIFPAGDAADSPSKWFISIFECQRQSTDTERAWWGDYKVQLRHTSDLSLEKRARLRRLADLWSILHHQHILRLFGASDSESLFFVCEYFEQKTLAEFACDNSSTSEDLFTFLFQVSLALLSLEEQGVWCQTLTCTDVVIDLDISLVKFDLLHVDLSDDPSDGKSVELLRNLGHEAFELWLSGSHSSLQLGSVMKRWGSLFVGEDQSADSSNAQPTLSEITCAVYMESIQPGRHPLNSLKDIVAEVEKREINDSSTKVWGQVQSLVMNSSSETFQSFRLLQPVLARLGRLLNTSLQNEVLFSVAESTVNFIEKIAKSKLPLQLALVLNSIQVTISLLEQLDELDSSSPHRQRMWEQPITVWRNDLVQMWTGIIKNGTLAKSITGGNMEDCLEALTIIEYEWATDRAVMTQGEREMYFIAFGAISEASNLCLLTVPFWFTPSYHIRSYKSKNRSMIIKQVVATRQSKHISVTEEVTVKQADQWSRLHHRNVVQLVNACHVGNDPLLAYDGSNSAYSLRKYLTTGERNPLEIWKLLQDAATGLAYLHGQQIAHRALTCDAILVCSEIASTTSACTIQFNDKRIGQNLVRRSSVRLMNGNLRGALSSKGEAETEHIELMQDECFEDMVAGDIASLGGCIIESVAGWEMDTLVSTDVFDRAECRRNFSQQAWAIVTSMILKQTNLEQVIMDIGVMLEEVKSAIIFGQKNQLLQPDLRIERIGVKEDGQLSIRDIGRAFQQLTSIRVQGKENGRINSLFDRLKNLYIHVQHMQKRNNLLQSKTEELILSLYNVLVPTATVASVTPRPPNPLKKAMDISRIHRQLDDVLLTAGVVIDEIEDDISEIVPDVGSGFDQGALRRIDNSCDNTAALKENQKMELKQAVINRDSELSTLMLAKSTSGSTLSKTSSNPIQLNQFNLRKHKLFISPFDLVIDQATSPSSSSADFVATWLDVRVTLKLFDPSASSSNFYEQVLFWNQLRHPNILKLYGASDIGHQLFVCELPSNGSLVDYLKSCPRELKSPAKYLHQAALGLAYFHKRGIIHCNLRGNNIVLGEDYQAKLMNFSFSGSFNKILDRKAEGDSRGYVETIRWLAPELLKGERPSTGSDIYAFGLCIVEVMTGNIPWFGMDEQEARESKMRWVPESDDHTFQPANISEQYRSLISKFCCQDMTLRQPASACVHLLEELAEYESNISQRETEQTQVQNQIYTVTGKKSSYQGMLAHFLRKIKDNGIMSDVESFYSDLKKASQPQQLLLRLKKKILEATKNSQIDSSDFEPLISEVESIYTAIERASEPLRLVEQMLKSSMTVIQRSVTEVRDLSGSLFHKKRGSSKSQANQHCAVQSAADWHDELEKLWEELQNVIKSSEVSDLYQSSIDDLTDIYNIIRMTPQPHHAVENVYVLVKDTVQLLQNASRTVLVTDLLPARTEQGSVNAVLDRIVALKRSIGINLYGLQRTQTPILKIPKTSNGIDTSDGLISGLGYYHATIDERDTNSVSHLKTTHHTYRSIDTDMVGSGDIAMRYPAWYIPWYELTGTQEQHIASGGFGSVYCAKWLEASVVVKRVQSTSTHDARRSTSKIFSIDLSNSKFVKTKSQTGKLRKLFQREANIWFNLNHPHVVRLFGASYDESQYLYVSEYASNGPLDNFLVQHPEQIWQKLYESALGLMYLHERGIVHGDLKCNNIVVGSDKKAKLTDFGLSLDVSNDDDDDKSGRVTGAWNWLAPELMLGRSETPTFESDVFSLGMCIVEALRVVTDVHTESKRHEPRVPWENVDRAVVARFIERGQNLPERPTICTDEQWELVKRMCKHNPNDRIRLRTVVNELSVLAGIYPHKHTSELSSQLDLLALASSVQDNIAHERSTVTSLGLRDNIYQFHGMLWERIVDIHSVVIANRNLDTLRQLELLAIDAQSRAKPVPVHSDSLKECTELALHAYRLHHQLDKLMVSAFAILDGSDLTNRKNIHNWKRRCYEILKVGSSGSCTSTL